MKKLLIALLTVTLVATTAAYAKPAHPKKPVHVSQAIPELKPVLATYNIYVGGVHFLTATILFEEENQKYHARVIAKTYGFWDKMFAWSSTLDASGKIDNDHFVPVLYTTHDIIKNKPPKDSKMAFGSNGDITVTYDPPKHDAPNPDDVTAEQKRGSYDPVTGLLQMLAFTAINKSCNTTVSVFDGKRRFDITGADSGNDMIDEKDYGVYRGPARICSADFKMIAGPWKDGEKVRFWEKNDKEVGREPFQIWLATISPDLPEMAVRLQSDSVWGLIVAHLTQWRYAGPDDLKP